MCNCKKALVVKIKRLSDKAVIPEYAKHDDACFDLVAADINETSDYIEYTTDLAFEIPEGYFGKIWPRSSVSKYDLIFSTSGVIDSGYRGNVTVRFKPKFDAHRGKEYQVGDRMAQMIILPKPTIKFIESDELSESERGAGGHGHSGV